MSTTVTAPTFWSAVSSAEDRQEICKQVHLENKCPLSGSREENQQKVHQRLGQVTLEGVAFKRTWTELQGQRRRSVVGRRAARERLHDQVKLGEFQELHEGG